MDFSDFAAIPVVDGHIHFPHPGLMDGFVAVMEHIGLARANLVGIPDLQTINQNPALIHFKAHHPQQVYVCGALDYTPAWTNPPRAPQALADQIAALRAIGFDGLKLVEGKPMVRKMLGIPFDGPEYAGMWAALEEQGFPIVFHVADPEEFWDADRCPDWARAQGWFYGDGTYPLKEDLYAEVDRVLQHHPGLRIVFAHFYFLSADLARAGAFLDAHPHVSIDLTPGVEMYLNFARDLDAARDFFVRYADRLVYGTDIGASAVQHDPSQGLDRAESLGRAWVVRRFLETDGPFAAPEGVGHWLGMDAEGFHGIALPPDVLAKIYHANFERMFGPAPAPLDYDAALAELERLAAVLDARAGGGPVDSPARQVAQHLATLADEGGR
jgi:predicted TIM-barrel fold metal-dependent hydrolase